MTEADATVFAGLHTGDAYYLSSSIMRENALEWDLVIAHKAYCNPGYFLNTKLMVCAECEAPFFSSGNAPKTCDRCLVGYFM